MSDVGATVRVFTVEKIDRPATSFVENGPDRCGRLIGKLRALRW